MRRLPPTSQSHAIGITRRGCQPNDERMNKLMMPTATVATQTSWRQLTWYATWRMSGRMVTIPNPNGAFHADAPIYIPVAKIRIPAAPVTCERICGST